GGKFNMTDVAAAIGLGQFAHIDAITEKRRSLAWHYFEAFGPDFETQSGVQLLLADTGNSNWHMYQLVLPERITRAAFMEKMMERQIGIGYHYPPIHLLKLYRERGFREGMFPIAERIGRRIVSLPMLTAMEKEDVKRVVGAVKSVLA
ncbi:MAG TPA: DegT/DnrJ/EryC1/StrS family aminotransferase, partial [Herbaspirillum sp.]|nr:DegT/DnrJ/EryC1/StrS family aminotransferase [Herbaspirillum sp.]